MSPRSPFLRYIVYFYGNLGIPLLPYDSLSGVVHLLKNICINLLCLVFLIFASTQSGDENLFTAFKFNKPMFEMFCQMFLVNTFPAASLIKLLHWLVYGPQIFHLLDAKCLRESFQRRPKLYFAIFFLANTAVFIGINLGNATDLSNLFLNSNGQSILKFLSNIYFHYSVVCMVNFQIFFIHIFQYATYQNLSQLYLNVSANVSQTQECSLMKQFIELSNLNGTFFKLISLPMFTYYYLFTVNTMTYIYLNCFIISFTGFWQAFSMLIFPILNAIYIYYLVHCNSQNVLLAEEIVEQFKTRPKEERWALRRRQPKPNGRLATKSAEISYTIRRYELEQFVDYFRLSLFSMVTLDKAFLFGTSLVALNYIVFIYQT